MTVLYYSVQVVTSGSAVVLSAFSLPSLVIPAATLTAAVTFTSASGAPFVFAEPEVFATLESIDSMMDIIVGLPVLPADLALFQVQLEIKPL